MINNNIKLGKILSYHEWQIWQMCTQHNVAQRSAVLYRYENKASTGHNHEHFGCWSGLSIQIYIKQQAN